MSSCLGLFVEDNLIKYAKVLKDGDKIKIENYGVKFYEQDIEKIVKQIVDETYSYKIPISINMSNEKYTNSKIFSLLSENDEKKCIKTEFDYFCDETGKNKLTLDYKTVVSRLTNDTDKKNVLYVFSEKGNIAEKIQLLDQYKMSNLFPTSLCIPDVGEKNNGNNLYINIEDRTELTTMVNGVAFKVDIIEEGMKEILSKIAERENSISKAYEICKNITLYTENSSNLQTENNEYLDIVISSINKIVEETRKIILNNEIEIENIYITGSGAIINNIDLYFQEKFMNNKCEILTPYFVDKTSLKINIKDYIEINSAIAIALQSFSKNAMDIDFDNKTVTAKKIKEILNSNVDIKNLKGMKLPKLKAKSKGNSKILNLSDIIYFRFAYSFFGVLIIYIIITTLVHGQIDKKIAETQDIIDDTKTKTMQISNYNSQIETRRKNYEKVLEQLNEASEKESESARRKNAIPNLLSEIMFAIPKETQILSIVNTDEKHIKIEAQSTEYPYLGYLKSEIQNKAILVNVTSTSGIREANDMIKVTIEGDLPY